MPPQDRSIRVEGVIIGHNDFGEADRILTIYSREVGKIRAIAKGVRKVRSRKAGHVEPITRANLQLARGRDLYILTQAEAIDVFSSLREDLVLLSYAFYVIELIDRSTTDQEEHIPLYNLLTQTLNRMNRGDNTNLATRYFEIRLLDFIGFRPQLITCTSCETEIKAEDQFFSANHGGVICPKCGQKETQSRPISMKALKYLRFFQRSSYKEAKRASVPRGIYDEMENILQYYFAYNLERGLNSPGFLRRVRKSQIK